MGPDILECFICQWESGEGEGGKGGRVVRWQGEKGGKVMM